MRLSIPGIQTSPKAYPELAAALKETGEEALIEASPRDYYWGEGRTGTGKNRLGEILKEERESYGKENTDPV